MSVFILMVWVSLSLALLSRRNNGLGDAVVKGFVIVLVAIAVTTEIATLFDAISLPVMASVWAGLVLAAVGLAWRRRAAGIAPQRIATSLAALFSGRDLAEPLALVLTGIVLAATLATALLAPPNTWDSMTYHMVRVAHWIQQGSVRYYATSIDRQNYQSPLAEFVILHLQLLSGSDRFANLVQWSALLVSAIAVALIVGELKGTRRAQVFAALLAVTLPMAILQSTSTQNDLLCGALCLVFVLFLLRTIRAAALEDALFCGLALGLSLLTKATAFLFCPAAGLVLGGAGLLGGRWLMSHPSAAEEAPPTAARPRLAAQLALAVLIGACLNTGYVARNIELYGHPLPTVGASYRNGNVSMAAVAGNVVRNVAMHLGLPSEPANERLTQMVRSVLGQQAGNPGTTWNHATFSIESSWSEDIAGNGLHMVLILGALVVGVVGRRAGRIARVYSAMLIVGALLYCVVLRWQPWASRLHTPLFLMALPLVATIVADGAALARDWWRVALVTVLFVCGLPYVLFNPSRPVVPDDGYSVVTVDRISQYFRNQRSVEQAYMAAARLVCREHPSEVGLVMADDDWEYPLWVLTGKHAVRTGPVFRHLGVTDISRKLALPGLPPPLILATRPVPEDVFCGERYETLLQSRVQVLRRVCR